MGKNIDAYIKEQFELPMVDVKTYSPLTLAYIGDGVFDLIIRSVIVGQGNTKASQLHRKTSQIVKASSQALLIETLVPYLTEEEMDVYRRGRNAKSPTTAKNATIGDYRKATGLEALIGYLYVTDQFERAVELTRLGLRKTDGISLD